MNNVSIIGRITRELELKSFNEGKGFYTRFTLAINKVSHKDMQPEADFINIVAWNGMAETLCKYLKKGSQIAITGRLSSNSYTDKDGNKRYSIEVVAEDFKFLDNKQQIV
ncbi:single-stranded DNA-binding protein [Clostridium sp. CM028]|uniref:single-stranded DNA-binding protein n=1 Tax=unclassified Clostridium TaxID=2614128 RepID=UPI001C0CDF29|nr:MULTISPECIES: single-stranded DNA-binding protein [unclassified Clostridium]MBU3092228.1 single-stranded DNA-binding protein [Clostridium sp. CF011]MBW9147644.1 single-stranded DNA-binding protein [Clostridium sp. CM028]WAG70301.1 single-stranded DNA-binding protein [Clostridium sp. CF011]WLC61974.1 single-stranded DNA-binding protein [Clostridium sp. CM028]